MIWFDIRLDLLSYENIMLTQRMMAKCVETPSGCWRWGRSLTPWGYGSQLVNGKEVAAHRLAYHLCRGDIQNGLYVMHECDNPWCVNPEHLRVGTNAANIQDASRRGRLSFATLRPEQVTAVLDLKAAEPHLSQRQIAKRVGIKQPQVWRILCGDLPLHLPEEVRERALIERTQRGPEKLGAKRRNQHRKRSDG